MLREIQITLITTPPFLSWDSTRSNCGKLISQHVEKKNLPLNFFWQDPSQFPWIFGESLISKTSSFVWKETLGIVEWPIFFANNLWKRQYQYCWQIMFSLTDSPNYNVLLWWSFLYWWWLLLAALSIPSAALVRKIAEGVVGQERGW